jgi:hypothetical protein
MELFTPNYGELKSIIENTTVYSMKDSTGTEFMFEVYPVHITESDLKEYASQVGEGRWFICYASELIQPTQEDIDEALEKGLLIKLFYNIQLIDNYGIYHTIKFNKELEKYKFVKNLLVINTDSLNMVLPLNNFLIKHIKNSSLKLKLRISNDMRFLSDVIFSEIVELKK